jgi:NADPH:quinone reductase-like Zn-dependent oxidoreductase
MKAVRIHEFGSTAEVLRYEEVPIPEPGPDELLIKIAAAALNRRIWLCAKGNYRITSDELPVIPGREFAGTCHPALCWNSGLQDWPASGGVP